MPQITKLKKNDQQYIFQSFRNNQLQQQIILDFFYATKQVIPQQFFAYLYPLKSFKIRSNAAQVQDLHVCFNKCFQKQTKNRKSYFTFFHINLIRNTQQMIGSVECSAFKNNQSQNSIRNRQVAIQSFWRQDKHKLGKINCSSGFFLSDDIIISAAHNFYIDQSQSLATDIRIIPLSQTNDPIINNSSQSFMVKIQLGINFFMQFHYNEANLKTYKIDLAIIKIQRIKTETNFIKTLSELEMNTNQKHKVIVSGHPDLTAKDADEQKKKMSQLKRSDVFTNTLDIIGSVCKISKNFIYYKTRFPTISGQSGGPIILQYDSIYYLVGIHLEYSSSISTGKGIVFSRQIVDTLEHWIALLKVTNKISYQYYYNLSQNIPKGGKINPLKMDKVVVNELREINIQQKKSIMNQHDQIKDRYENKKQIQKILKNINEQIQSLQHILKEIQRQFETIPKLYFIPSQTGQQSLAKKSELNKNEKQIKEIIQKINPLMQQMKNKNNQYLPRLSYFLLEELNPKYLILKYQDWQTNFSQKQFNFSEEYYIQMKKLYELSYLCFLSNFKDNSLIRFQDFRKINQKCQFQKDFYDDHSLLLNST